jgi:CTP:molybdopterin cytidylyltransferase MocA
MTIPILILAAGASSRMRGVDKLMLPVDGQPLLRRIAAAACAAGAGPVLVALPPAPHPRHGALDGLDLIRVGVADAAEGMNASLRAVLAAIPGPFEAVMVLLADLPGLTAGDLKHIIQCVDTKTENLIWRGMTETGAPGHPVVFSARLLPELAALHGDGGAQSVVQRHRDRMVPIPLPGDHAHRDLDTPEDWAAWHRDHG